MHFLDFCRLHGVIIDREPPIGVWKRYPTEDKRHHRNGAVKFMGDHAFVQNHATETEISVWHSDSDSVMYPNKARKAVEAAAWDIRQKQQEAARKAGFILHQCQIGYHPYLERKGFPDEQGNVWKTNDGLLLVIPMRVGHQIVGCQIIREDGEKKFLAGQRTSNAAFTFDNKGDHILVEGYATALSVRAAMKALKRRYTLHVCFSAGNLVKVAATLPRGYVIADHDKLNPSTGTRAGHEVVKKVGWPFFMPEQEGMDFNDLHQSTSLFKCSQALDKMFRKEKV
jgi:putative DNA primase/helicase